MPRWFDEDADGIVRRHVAVARLLRDGRRTARVRRARRSRGSPRSTCTGDGSPIGVRRHRVDGDTVYASTTNLYLATHAVGLAWCQPWRSRTSRETSPAETSPPPTLIHQFRLGDGTGATYVASGEVPGSLAQPVRDERAQRRPAGRHHHRRLERFGEQSESAVYVLRPEGEELRQIGVGRRARQGPSRSTPSASSGTQAYVVTFRQTDPLYVIDLTDPTNPVGDRRAEDPRLLGLPASGRRRPAARRRPGRHRGRPHARHAAVSCST